MISKQTFINDFKDLLSITNDIDMEMDLLDIDEWDSFSAMLFISMAKDKYGMDVEPFSIAEAVLVEDLYNVVNQ